MPLIRRRPLLRAAMVGGAGYAAGKRRGANASEQAQPAAAPAPAASAAPSSESERIDTLTKLKGLLDSGVLTQEQYDSERQRLTEGM
jgi:putative oligomerization/nucleic acid binding protein